LHKKRAANWERLTGDLCLFGKVCYFETQRGGQTATLFTQMIFFFYKDSLFTPILLKTHKFSLFSCVVKRPIEKGFVRHTAS